MEKPSTKNMQKEHTTLNPDIEEKIRLIESGKARGKAYTPDDYLKHMD